MKATRCSLLKSKEKNKGQIFSSGKLEWERIGRKGDHDMKKRESITSLRIESFQWVGKVSGMRTARTWNARPDIIEYDVREEQVTKPRRGVMTVPMHWGPVGWPDQCRPGVDTAWDDWWLLNWLQKMDKMIPNHSTGKLEWDHVYLHTWFVL